MTEATGTCSYCHHIRGLRSDGTMVQHTHSGSMMCPGSLKLPKDDPHKFVVLLSFHLKHPEDIALVMEKIDPVHLPYFAGTARIAIDPVATKVEEWLDADE